MNSQSQPILEDENIVFYYMIWSVCYQIQGISAVYGDHQILKLYDLLRKYQERADCARKDPRKAEVTGHVTRKCLLIGSCQDTVDDVTHQAIFRTWQVAVIPC